jgi:hypothetical protein
MPLTWPFGHVISAVSRDPNDVASKPTNSPDLDIIGHATACVAATRSFLLACLFIFIFHDGVEGETPLVFPVSSGLVCVSVTNAFHFIATFALFYHRPAAPCNRFIIATIGSLATMSGVAGPGLHWTFTPAPLCRALVMRSARVHLGDTREA